MTLDLLFTSFGIGGGIGVMLAAVALGIRHGIDWDHIAAITDITSTAAWVDEEGESAWLTHEPGVMLTDESHHSMSAVAMGTVAAAGVPSSAALALPHSHSIGELGHRHNGHRSPGYLPKVNRFVRTQKPALFLGSMYAIGHGTMVVVLGLLALWASQFLPDWLDPIMERIVGATLIILAVYLFYSVFQYYRGGKDFRLRSRWMLLFAGARNAMSALREKIFGTPHEHVHEAQQYGGKTAYAVGLIHGVGAETGTQVLVIATAVGAGSRAMGTATLGAFVIGLLISNSIVTVVSTAGFVSSQRRQSIYVIAGLLAAIFSFIVGCFFLFREAGILPDLDPYFRWIGGGS